MDVVSFVLVFVTINATPIKIIIIAMTVIAVIFSCNIAHPNKTAITGLTYAKVFANDAEVTKKPVKVGKSYDSNDYNQIYLCS